MKLAPVIAAIKSRCPSFANRVAGAAEFASLPQSANLAVPACYVIPLHDDPTPNKSQTGLIQEVKETIAVVVVVTNQSDERGQTAHEAIQDIKTELWHALLGWSNNEALYTPFEYAGGNLLRMDRARLFWQFEFSAEITIDATDGYISSRDAAYGGFTGATIKIDVIDPAFDKNLASTGPDGRIEFQAVANPPQS